MQPDKLTRMANQIATFFASQPEAERVNGVATHINKFWEPRMRRDFFTLVDAGGEGMLPLVIEAAKKVNRPEPVAQTAH
jgi:formate dehydrogenase subunit delta